jgi:hypothetical protein
MNIINQMIYNQPKIILNVIGGISGFTTMHDFNIQNAKTQNTLLPLFTNIDFSYMRNPNEVRGGTILGLSFPKTIIALVCINDFVDW